MPDVHIIPDWARGVKELEEISILLFVLKKKMEECVHRTLIPHLSAKRMKITEWRKWKVQNRTWPSFYGP